MKYFCTISRDKASVSQHKRALCLIMILMEIVMDSDEVFYLTVFDT